MAPAPSTAWMGRGDKAEDAADRGCVGLGFGLTWT